MFHTHLMWLFSQEELLPSCFGFFTLQSTVHTTTGPITLESASSMCLFYSEWNFHSFSLSNWIKLELFMLGLQGPTFLFTPFDFVFVLFLFRMSPPTASWAGLTLSFCSCLLEWEASFPVSVTSINVLSYGWARGRRMNEACILSQQTSRYKHTPTYLHTRKHHTLLSTDGEKEPLLSSLLPGRRWQS